jgi:hypothetical protein
MKRLIYRGGRPGLLARLLNGFWARQYSSARLARDRDVTLEVQGRSSGKTIIFPVVMADYAGDWFVVSMLGEHAKLGAQRASCPGACRHSTRRCACG